MSGDVATAVSSGCCNEAWILEDVIHAWQAEQYLDQPEWWVPHETIYQAVF